MKDEERYLLDCMAAFVAGRGMAPFTGDWRRLIHLANIHSVMGIVGNAVMTGPEPLEPGLHKFLRMRTLQTVTLQGQRAQAMAQLLEKLDEAGVDRLLFKGYILREYYPVPELRTFGDIDFLIRKEDRETCDAVMMGLGFERKTDWEPVYSYLKGAEYYEIHTDVMEVDVSDQADYKGYFSHTWERAQQLEGHTWVLSPEDHLIYLLTHIAKHICGSGAGIRMYLDIALMLKHFQGQLDWDYLKGELKKLHFTDFSNMVFTLVEKSFGVPCPMKLRPVKDEVLEDFLEYTLAGGVFGGVGRESGVISLKKDMTDGETVSRGKTLRRRLFPAASTIESRYTYLQGRHWLLPAAWVHRFIRTGKTFGSHAREAQTILTADTEEVRRLKRVYKEIGL